MHRRLADEGGRNADMLATGSGRGMVVGFREDLNVRVVQPLVGVGRVLAVLGTLLGREWLVGFRGCGAAC